MNIELNRINEWIYERPEQYVALCDEQYNLRVAEAADKLKERVSRSKIILLAGPSSSGKTTTASRVKKALLERGIYCHMISLDDYYRNKTEEGFPRTKTGDYDLESPLALQTDLLNDQLTALDSGEEILIPHFDFQQQRQCPELAKPLRLKENEVVLFEGIHGLNPMLTDRHPEASRLFVSTASSVVNRYMEVFDRVWMRVIRRIVRDFNYRSSSAAETLGMWHNVRLGEKHYISPYKATAHITIDTTHGYEVSAFRSIAEPLLLGVENNAQPDLTRDILEALKLFIPLSVDLLPPTSLLKEEFIK